MSTVDPTLGGVQGAPTPAGQSVLQQAAAERKQARTETWHLLRRRPGFIIGSIIVVWWVTCAVLYDRITPKDPFSDLDTPLARPSSGHWFGTDQIGRDVFSRVMAGSRDVLVIAPIAALLCVIVGTLLGLAMGYFRGLTDDIISRVVEAFLALPVVLVGLLALVTFGTSRPVVILVVAVLFTPIVARTVRAAVIAERDLDYVTSARLRGENNLFIMTREILPNIIGPIIVELTVRIGYAIFTVATLSFLGVGVQPPSPDWGLIISDHYNLMNGGIWWPTLFPALAIASLVIAVNLIADSIQAVTDR
jgi:peptide/nickel transport system permease protein